MKKIFCILSISASAVFTAYYLHFGGLFGNSSALSKVGLTHPVYFAVWCILTYSALSYNLHTAYAKTKYKFYIPMLIISGMGMILTLCCDFNYDIYPQYIAHCIGSLTFSALMGISIFLLFLLTQKYVFAVISGTILIADLILLIIFKETALIETVPIFIGYILLGINNFAKEKELIEA